MLNGVKDYLRKKLRNQIRLYDQEERDHRGMAHMSGQTDACFSYYLSSTLDRLASNNLWWAEIKVYPDRIEANGWAILPPELQNNVAFTINNELVDETNFPICNPGLAKIYYFKPNSAMCGFKCVKLSGGTELTKAGNLLSCQIVDKRTLSPLDGFYPVHSEVDELDSLPWPDDSNMARIGAQNLQHYKSVGFDKFMRLEEALEKYEHKTFADTNKVLDWGCGCGEVLRYLNRYSNIEVHGADIDPINIEWCEKHLPFAKYHLVPLLPTTELPAEYYDVIFGISVVTHLREDDQSAWLAELARISKKGGLVLLSVHGDAGVAFRNELFNYDKLLRWQEKGFLVAGVDNAIGDMLDDKEYYTTSFQTDWYIKQEWSKYFEVVDIIPAYIGHFQDLVVLKKE
jgi:2-polyprenyl-3-methyl-5-hydroxy-6-metoxy-1,4-benzoquinol methylase